MKYEDIESILVYAIADTYNGEDWVLLNKSPISFDCDSTGITVIALLYSFHDIERLGSINDPEIGVRPLVTVVNAEKFMQVALDMANIAGYEIKAVKA